MDITRVQVRERVMRRAVYLRLILDWRPLRETFLVEDKKRDRQIPSLNDDGDRGSGQTAAAIPPRYLIAQRILQKSGLSRRSAFDIASSMVPPPPPLIRDIPSTKKRTKKEVK